MEHRKYKNNDIFNIDADEENNPCLKVEGMYKFLNDVALTFGGETVLDDGKIVCIAIWKEYVPDVFTSMLVISKDFKLKYVRYVKDIVYALIKRYKPKIVDTISADNDKLNRWHKFLGMKCIEAQTVFDIPHLTWRIEGDK